MEAKTSCKDSQGIIGYLEFAGFLEFVGDSGTKRFCDLNKNISRERSIFSPVRLIETIGFSFPV